MPLAAILGGLGAAVGSAINSGSQESINRQNIQFQKDLYNQQFRDNFWLWQQQNAYNSPQSQMQRYQEAGLNPALMYSQGSPGVAAQLKSPDTAPPQLRSPEWGNSIGSGLAVLSQMYDLDIKAAQADNLKAQSTVIQQDALLREAQVAQTQTGTERAKFDLGFEQKMTDISAEARREQLRQTKTNIDLSLNRDAREAVSNATSVQEAYDRMKTASEQRLSAKAARAKTYEEIKSIKLERDRLVQNISLLKQQGTLNDLDIELKKKGIMPHDPLWARIVGRLLDKFFTSDGSFRMPRIR